MVGQKVSFVRALQSCRDEARVDTTKEALNITNETTKDTKIDIEKVVHEIRRSCKGRVRWLDGSGWCRLASQLPHLCKSSLFHCDVMKDAPKMLYWMPLIRLHRTIQRKPGLSGQKLQKCANLWSRPSFVMCTSAHSRSLHFHYHDDKAVCLLKDVWFLLRESYNERKS